MEIEYALIDLLLATPAVTGVFGTRITFGVLPDKQPMPAVSVARVSGRRWASLPFASPVIQVTIYATSAAGARVGAKAIRETLDRRKVIQSGVTMVRITHLNDLDLHDPETGRYIVPMDFKVLAEEE